MRLSLLTNKLRGKFNMAPTVKNNIKNNLTLMRLWIISFFKLFITLFIVINNKNIQFTVLE